MWRLLLLSLFLCLTFKKVAATEAVEEDEAQMTIEKLVEIGSNLKLKGEVDFGEWCYFVFKHPEDNYQCCYGEKEKRDCESSNTFQNQNDTTCLTEEEYSVMRRKTTCVLVIKNIGESSIGLYMVYNMDHDQIQKCHVNTVEERECRSENDINVHKGKALTLTSDIEPLSRCYFVSTDSDSLFPTDELLN